MNNSNKLGHLLNEARMEPSIISEEEVRNLLQEKGRIKDSYISFIIQQIQGVPFMYKLSLGIAVAAIIGLITSNVLKTGQTPVTKVAIKHDQKQNVKVVKVIKQDTETLKQNDSEITNKQSENKQVKFYQYKINKADVASEEPQNQENPKDFQWTSNDHINPVNVKGINYIQLTPAQLTNMGIVTNSLGELKYWDNWGTINSKEVLCTLFVNGGLGTKEKNNPDYDDIKNPGFSPRLITDNKGNRRVFIENDEEAHILNTQYEERKFSDDTNNNYRNILLNKKIYQSPENISKNKEEYFQNKIKEIRLHFIESKNNKNIDIDSLVEQEIQQNIELFKQSNPDSSSLAELRTILKKSIDYDTRAANLINKINSDDLTTVMEDIENNTNIENTDSVIDITENGATKKMAFQITLYKNLNNNGDTTSQAKNTYNIKNKLDITDTNVSHNDYHLEDIALNEEGLNAIADKVMLDQMNYKIKNLNDNINELIKINKLIPVLVPMGKVESDNELIDKDNFGFVLWFDPTREFISALPEDVRNKLDKELVSLSTTTDVCNSTAIAGEEPYMEVWRSCSGAVENLNVYPNPTNGKININFSLTENRNVTISIHDMFGNVVKELSANQSSIPGQYNDEFNIADFESGMYLISIQTENGEAAVQRIVLVK